MWQLNFIHHWIWKAMQYFWESWVFLVLWWCANFPYPWKKISCWYLLHQGSGGRLPRCCCSVSVTDSCHPASWGHSGLSYRPGGDWDFQWNVAGMNLLMASLNKHHWYCYTLELGEGGYWSADMRLGSANRSVITLLQVENEFARMSNLRMLIQLIAQVQRLTYIMCFSDPGWEQRLGLFSPDGKCNTTTPAHMTHLRTLSSYGPDVHLMYILTQVIRIAYYEWYTMYQQTSPYRCSYSVYVYIS